MRNCFLGVIIWLLLSNSLNAQDIRRASIDEKSYSVFAKIIDTDLSDSSSIQYIGINNLTDTEFNCVLHFSGNNLQKVQAEGAKKLLDSFCTHNKKSYAIDFSKVKHCVSSPIILPARTLKCLSSNLKPFAWYANFSNCVFNEDGSYALCYLTFCSLSGECTYNLYLLKKSDSHWEIILKNHL